MRRWGSKERKLVLAGGDRTAHQQMRALLWEDVLNALAREWRIDLRQLPGQRSAPQKVRLAAAMKQVSSVSNGWLADRLQMGPAASVSQYVRRFNLAGRNRQPASQRALSKVKT